MSATTKLKKFYFWFTSFLSSKPAARLLVKKELDIGLWLEVISAAETEVNLLTNGICPRLEGILDIFCSSGMISFTSLETIKLNKKIITWKYTQ